MEQERRGQLPLEQAEDLGFRVFKLAPSNFRAWSGSPEAEPGAYAEQMALFNDPLEAGWDEQAVICEVALKEGYGLNLHIEASGDIPQAHKASAPIYRVTDPDCGQNFYITLAERIQPDQIHGLAFGSEMLFVCRDIALSDESAANLALQCRLKTI